MGILSKIRSMRPLVHCITNYVTVNDVANSLLAIGASPVMADDEREVEEMVSIANALVINIGTLNERTINAMIKAGKKANELNLPVVLDPVGVGATKLRTDTAFRLINEIKFTLIRGNVSEIGVLAGGFGSTRGVDASEKDIDNGLQKAIEYAREVNKNTDCIVAVSGKIDVVSDKSKTIICENGNASMAQISGSGCILSALLGAFLATEEDKLKAVSLGVAAMGICGEKAFEKTIKEKHSIASFKAFLIDALHDLGDEELNISKIVSKIKI